MFKHARQQGNQEHLLRQSWVDYNMVGCKVLLLTSICLAKSCTHAQVKGPERDIHSGNDGGVFNEPLSDLTKLLASLVDSRNNITVPGFYSGVRPNTLGAALQRLDGCHEFSLEGYREALGIPKLASAANMRSASRQSSHTTLCRSSPLLDDFLLSYCVRRCFNLAYSNMSVKIVDALLCILPARG